MKGFQDMKVLKQERTELGLLLKKVTSVDLILDESTKTGKDRAGPVS
jgi:hypothetical protein